MAPLIGHPIWLNDKQCDCCKERYSCYEINEAAVCRETKVRGRETFKIRAIVYEEVSTSHGEGQLPVDLCPRCLYIGLTSLASLNKPKPQ